MLLQRHVVLRWGDILAKTGAELLSATKVAVAADDILVVIEP